MRRHGLVVFMNISVPEHIQSLRPYVPGKPIDETRREYGVKNVIKLASNENPLGPSPRAVSALKKGLKDLHLYPDAASYDLKEAISKKYKINPEECILGNGSNEIIDFLVRTYCVAGDQVVTHAKAFIAYRICAQVHGVETIETPIDRDTLQVNLDAMLQQIQQNERVKLVFLANPNNPTGCWIQDRALLDFLGDVARVRGGSVLVVLDLAYWEYVGQKSNLDTVNLFQKFSNVVSLYTFSKIYGLAGLRLGYAFGRSEIIMPLEKVRAPFNINSLAQKAGIAALLDSHFVKKSLQLNAREMKKFCDQLTKWEAPFIPSVGNFLLVNTKKTWNKTGLELCEALLKKGIILRPVANYGLDSFVRITIGTTEQMKRLTKALDEVRCASHGS